MIVGILLAVIVCGVLVARTLRGSPEHALRPSRTVVVLIGITLAGLVVIFDGPHWEAPARAVFVLIDPLPNDYRARVDELAKQGNISAYDAVVVTPDGTADPPSHRRWQTRASPPWSPRRESSVVAAIEFASGRFADPPWIRPWDAMTVVPHRVVFSMSSSRELDRRPQYGTAIASSYVALRKAVDDVDVVWTSGRSTSAEPMGNLLIRPPQTVSTQVLLTEDIGLELRALPAGLPSTFEAAVRVDLDPTDPTGSFWFEKKDLTFVRQGDVATATVSLNDLKGDPGHTRDARRDAGWHLLKARVAVKGNSGAPAWLAEDSRYFQARLGAIQTILDGSRRFRLDDAPHPLSVAAIRDVWKETINDQKAKSVILSDLTLASDFAAAPLSPPATPRVITLIHPSAVFWKQKEDSLRRVVEHGAVLFCVGLPPAASADWLPLQPLHSPTSATATLMLDRRPRVTVLRDLSRLGALKFHPKDPTSLDVQVETYAESEAHQEYSDGREAQERLVGKLVDRLEPLGVELEDNTIPQNPRPAYVMLSDREVAASKNAAGLEDGASEMAAASQLKAIAGDESAHLKSSTADVIQVNHAAIVMTYDIAQLPSKLHAVAQLAASGTLIYVVRLHTPFARGVNEVVSSPMSIPGFLESEADEAAQMVGRRDTDFARWITPEHAGERVVRDLDLDLYLDRPDDFEAQLNGVATRIAEDLGRRFPPATATGRARRWGRAIDPEGVARGTDAFAAPLLMELVDQDPSGPFRVYAETEEKPAARGRLEPIPMLLGRAWGAGAVFVTTYSCFEGAGGDFFAKAPWSGNVRDRIVLPGAAGHDDHWGPRRILDLIRGYGSLDPHFGDEPSVAGGSAMSDGYLRLSVYMNPHRHASIDRLDLVPAKDWFEDVPPTGAPGIDGSLQGFQATNTLEYEFAPDDLHSKGTRGYPARLRRTTEENGKAVEKFSEFFFVPPQATGPGSSVGTHSRTSLTALARYLRGREFESEAYKPAKVSPRPIALFALFALIGSFWATRLARRLFFRKRIQREIERGENPLTLPPIGSVRTPSTTGGPRNPLPIGAPMTLRPIEAGDSLRTVPDTELLLRHRLMQDGRSAPLRVRDRMDERTRHVRIMVQVGSSMRLPSATAVNGVPEHHIFPKISAAARLADHLSNWASRRHSRVEVWVLGLGRAPEYLEQVAEGIHIAHSLDQLISGPGEIEARIVAAVQRSSSGRLPRLWADADSPISLIYISDFLREDLAELTRLARDLEDGQSLFGAAHVYSATEFLMLDGGLTVDDAVASNRQDFAPADLEIAHRRFVQHLLSTFEEYAGGLAILPAHADENGMDTALESSRLIEVL